MCFKSDNIFSRFLWFTQTCRSEYVCVCGITFELLHVLFLPNVNWYRLWYLKHSSYTQWITLMPVWVFILLHNLLSSLNTELVKKAMHKCMFRPTCITHIHAAEPHSMTCYCLHKCMITNAFFRLVLPWIKLFRGLIVMWKHKLWVYLIHWDVAHS